MTSQPTTSPPSPAPSESSLVIDRTAGFPDSTKFRANGNRASLVLGPLLGCLVLWMPIAVMAADPPPPPAPSQTTTSGQVTTARGVELVTGTVSDFNPAGAGIAYVKTNTIPPTVETVHLVKTTGQTFYPSSGAEYYLIVGAASGGNVLLTRFYLPDGNPNTFEGLDSTALSSPLVQSTTNYTALFSTSGGTPGDPAVDPTPAVTGTGGLLIQSLGANGGDGHDGALFVPPASGKNGTKPTSLTYTNTVNRTATGGIGIEARSIGGNGGDGGDSYASPFGGKPGGTGGAGGNVDLTNAVGVQVSATGNGKHGINAYSTSGKGGSGGEGYGAPSGGAGGGAYSGGNVTVTNNGNVFSNGTGAHGILATSKSGRGGEGGAQYGLFGEGGSGAIPGNGGKVTVTNALGARIQTNGDASHGIAAMSLGGNGGAGGTSANLFASEAGAGGGGGNGDDVSVTNRGIIVTQGNFSRGVFAQSVGGGGGNGGFGLGLVAIGGTGSLGGTAGEVTVVNSGSITTSGVRSDGLFAQSVAGTGGTGGSVAGLVTFGGSGGPGGQGNAVSIENSGTIVTSQNLTRNASGNIPEITVSPGEISSRGGRGIVAQSIGGGGGDGGSATGMVSLGGSGGSGQKGGLVTVVNSGEIYTHGDDATGIFAQSVGGGGGNGGSATAIGAFVAVGVGGKGGSGAHGGTVNVTLQGRNALDPSAIETDGMRSFGVFAQSVGGGGGNGGGSTAISAGIGGSVSVAVGGSGGTGGNGGNVVLDDGTGGKGNVTTGDDFSTGVFVQSVGGGGGNGGYATSVAAAGGPVGVSVAVGKGGDGGAAGTGGTVLVGHRASAGSPVTSWDGVGPVTAGETGFNGKIWTKGAFSTGFIAQSVGGGGGNGGASVTVPVAVGAAGAAAIGVGVGGNAGEGSNGGLVRVGTAGDVWTEKEFSPGMLVQSVGGGGGNGGTSVVTAAAAGGGASGAVSVGIGGSGAKGSTGGDVFFATGQGLVWTKGESSTGIIAQSIGGGGGNGGFSVSGALAVAGGGAGAVSVGLGGGGGDGGESGTVTTHLQSDVLTEGFSSTGILVQAVGGGGGNGGYNVSASLAGAGGGAGAVSVGLGGNGGKASAGGVVNATATGTIATLGHSSSGFIAQSVGGGGGNGGFNVSAGAAGAGAAAGSVSVGLGGTGAGGGAGGKVTAATGDETVRPDVLTQGDNSTGILAQSVGGGGGNGGFNVSVAVSGSGVAAGSVGVGLGGSGGGGGDGGEVDLTVRNNVSTGLVADGLTDVTGAATDRTGHYSAGVIAQSVGGGGGNGGFNVTAGIAGSGTVAGGVGIGLGGDGALGGKSAAPVTLDMEGNITTRGDYAGGLIAQSVGGGGGNGGFNVSAAISGAGVASGQVGVGLGGSAGDGGSATGLVKSSLTGNVITKGDYSSGVTAQSVGGGGGNGGFNITGAIGGAGTASASVGVGLGGSGGNGGHSGASVAAGTMGDGTADVLLNNSMVVVDNTVKGNVTTSGRNSHGIVAQSMGGGGGNGGFDITGSISGAGVGSGAVSVGLGGSGGDGGHSAGVRNFVEGTSVTTKKNDSIGILAQSVGGGGGSGGFSISGSISGAGTGSGAVSVGLGGSGGGGGHAGAVTNTVIVDEILTEGAGDSPEEAGNSAGVVAQSLGGGGGNGGFSIAGAISGAGTGSGAVGVGLGGSGGDGGNSSNVKNTVTGNVTTKQQESVGIMAQSLGGGGGNGGFSVTGSITGAGTGSGGVSVGIGGSGGGGGNSGANVSDLVVDNTVTGNVTTEGEKSSGVVAQALGGGGGNGGFSVAAVLSGAGTASGAVSVGIGGSGGDGGNAGRVKNSVTGDIATQSDESDGVLAQSLGGGGGNGGFNVSGAITGAGKASAGVGVGIGGSGGNGGHSGAIVIAGTKGDGKADVLVDNSLLAVDNVVTGNVATEGAKSNGVVAQSIGGGGGNGGFNVSAVLSGAGTASGAVSVGIGGSGGDGGHSGSVRNSVTGDVSTQQKESVGVIAQSVGGGGGNGGFNVSGNISGGSKASAGLSVGIGGSGGGGGHSGNVDNTVIGDVSTTGADSGGILAQSVGGGGGNGGFNISGVISAGGNGSGAVSVGIGGSGGDGGNSGNVVNRVTGDVMTTGKGSNAILAQSVGGGGGNGGFNITGAINLSKENGGTLGVGIGGFGGKGGNSGNVTSTVTTAALNQTATTGDNSAAVVAQSIGGGGGNGGVNVNGTLSLTGKTGASIGVGVGGFGGEAGNAGNAGATVTGNYVTTGKNSDGIIVQSLGGGGGNGGLNVTGSIGLSTGGSSGQASVGIGGFGADGGSSGTATLMRTGDTMTSGANSEAIIVQSLAGGGGNGGVNITAGLTASKSDNASLNFGLGGFGGKGSDADTVTATIIGNVAATGLGDAAADAPPQLFSGAVVAQSVGGGGGKGGLNVSGGVTLTKSDSSAKVATIGIGGFGGGGGDGGDVNLDIHAPGPDRVYVVANGDNRAGVIAQSLGGGGGLGGINISGGISTNSALAFGMGGFGGNGGVSKAVTAKVTTDIQVTGNGTRGLVAQSLGGGGGAGGINVSGTVNINSSDDTSLTFGLGGFGGTGNISGNVDVTQKGFVIVRGENGIGILAQSVAGGGGDGGLNISANIANAGSGKSTNRVIAGVGGTAGTGADAGDVTVNSLDAISIIGPASTSPADKAEDAKTTVFNSAGILAQSIGGGGGLGGMNISASAARNAGNTLQFGMGGSGGAGGNAGSVSVTRGYETTLAGEVVNASSIHTAGDFSSGIVAQSVGGGGGSAGMNFNFAYNKESNPDDGKKYTAAIISVGGSGANAGDGDTVTVRHNGDINTDGIFSHGVVAQSIGGGGGSSNVNLGAGVLGDKTKGINFGLGGSNGAAGSGAIVDVDHVGTIFTNGNSSMGIKAQSIGGGGGSANGINQYLDPVLDLITGQLDSASIGINIGRKGGTGGTGGEVRVKSDGLIHTHGDQSIGILAQSIGGGGGDSGTTTFGGDFTAKSGTYGGNLAIGLDGGTAATGGVVTVTTRGEISTLGERAHAIFAQSLGGGGGMGGTVGDKLALSTGEDEDTTNADISIGGDGGDGSYSQQVTVDNSAKLLTYGDRSSAIWAQSIGGTGGNGGDFLLANIENINGGKTSRSFAVNVGGSGGTGAVGGGVSVTNSGLIHTAGLQSFGIRAESIGGGGGDGGAVSQGSLVTGSGSKQSVNINVGGKGGDGGKGSLVEVTNEGSIQTRGFGADGIRATSTGGGGGNAGVVINTLLTLTGAESQTQSVAMNFGGSGGTGGTGGDVTVHNTRTKAERSGEILTHGDSAHGVFAQSLGGGGGNGSSIISMTGLRNTEDSFAVGLNFGGSGGSGNFAGAVTVENSGTISTEGKNAYGILAQSTGGGGGNGGLVIAAGAAFGQMANAPVLAIGGMGGDGGNGGKVDVTNTGNIFTSGAGSHGIVAQSIGGGGGNSGIGIAATNNKASFAVSNLVSLIAGATGGGTGGTGGEVNVTQNGNVNVTGEGAQAIMAESINGGGGHLNFDLSGVAGMPGFSFKKVFKDAFGIKDADAVIDPKIATRLGGTDLSKMNASKVTITTRGNLGVAGNNSVGSFDQSLGGGGGTLFLKTRQADAASIGSGLTPTAISYQVNLGSANGTDNSGANIAARQKGSILSTGFNTMGVLSQTIGGGGGRAIVDITAEEGALVGPIDISLGGTEGSNESGGGIFRQQTGDIVTAKDLSTAMLLQSIGGGGGSASVVLHDKGTQDASPLPRPSAAPAPSRVAMASAALAPTPGPTSTLSLGASGGSNLNGGDIVSTSKGNVNTSGNHALGLVAQSIGAGGGEIRHSGTGAVSVDIGGKNGASGDGGRVVIRHSGDVQTSGAGSNAVFLQSIGGGGGSVFTDLDPSQVLVARKSANKGNGGAIRFDQKGDIIASGEQSIGVLAQSLGGGGGVIDRVFMNSAGGAGNSGAIHLMLDGNIMADGFEGIGVFAQSRAAGPQGNISVTLAANKRLSFGANGTGLWLSGGANNRFVNKGTVAGIDGLLGWGVRGAEGNDSVSSRKTYLGQFNLGSGVNSFTNEAGALFVPGPQLLLGDATNLLTQSGTMLPGDMMNTQRSTLKGSYIQTATGKNFSELDFGSAAPNVDGGLIDQINATGTADLAGRMDISLLNPQLVPSGHFQKTLMSADLGVTDSGMELTTAPSVVITYDLLYSTGFAAVLDYNVDFSPGGLGENLQEVGYYFNRVQSVGSSTELADTVIKLLYDPDMETYRQTLSQMSPDFYAELQSEAIRGSQRFGDILLDGGPFRFFQNDYMLWFNFRNDSRERDAYNDYKDFSSDTSGISLGIRKSLTKEWSAGIGFLHEDSTSFGYNRRWTGTTTSERVGLSIERETGPTRLGATLSYGWDSSQINRDGNVTAPFETDLSRQLETLAAILSYSREFTHEGAYFRPGVDLGYTYLSGESGVENGAGPLNLEIGGTYESHLWIRPEIDMGYRFDDIFGSDVQARLFASVGLQQYLTDPETTVTAGLQGAPGGVSPMHVPVELDQTEIQTAIGIELMTRENGSMSFQYGKSFSDHTDVDLWSLNLRIPF